MATTALLSTVVTGAVLIAVIAVVLRIRRWEHPAPSIAADPGTVTQRINGPLGWSIAFFLATFLVMGFGMLYAAGESMAGLDPATLELGLIASLGAVILVAIIVAVYGTVKSRGLNNAQAAAISSTLFLLLFLAAIVVQLFMGG